MLRRNSSKSSRRKQLNRSKSTSSIQRNPVEDLQLFDPVIAERDAQIAARLSYQRAHGRTMAYPQGVAGPSSANGTAIPSSPEFERSGNGSRLMVRSEGATSRQGTHEGEESRGGGLKHQKSIRFAGPTAQPRRVLASRATEPGVSASESLSRLTVADNSVVVPPRAQTAFDRHRDSSYSMDSLSPLEGLAAISIRPDSSRGEGPSFSALQRESTRQVRKTRSMYPGSEYFDSLFQDSPGEAKEEQSAFRSRYANLNNDKENEREPPVLESKSLRAPKSMSLLRSRRAHSSSQSTDLAVQMARDNFKQQNETQPRLKSQPSLFFRSKERRAATSMSFRKSLRNSSNTSAAVSALSNNSVVVAKGGGSLRMTARKVSQSLKTKFKGMFGRKSSDDSIAERESDTESSIQIPWREVAVYVDSPARTATLHTPHPSELVESHEASIHSGSDAELVEDEGPSGAEERSRVTSWSDSITDTMPPHPVCDEWERQRLSVIHENGLHFASPVIDRTTVNRGIAIGHPSPIDSQRVYSALMKRAEEAQRNEDDERQQNIADIRSQGRAPPRGSSVDQLDTATATIRRVEPDDNDVFQDKANGDSKAGNAFASVNRMSSPDGSCHAIPEEGDSPGWQAPGITAYHQKRGDHERTRIVDRSSAFFASPANHFFRAQSPFRRALQENMRAADQNAPIRNGYLASLSELSLPARQPSLSGSAKNKSGQDGESIYSYNENGGEYQREADSEHLVDRFPNPPLSHSSTDISSSHTDKSMSAPYLGQRPDSAASSVE